MKSIWLNMNDFIDIGAFSPFLTSSRLYSLIDKFDLIPGVVRCCHKISKNQFGPQCAWNSPIQSFQQFLMLWWIFCHSRILSWKTSTRRAWKSPLSMFHPCHEYIHFLYLQSAYCYSWAECTLLCLLWWVKFSAFMGDSVATWSFLSSPSMWSIEMTSMR